MGVRLVKYGVMNGTGTYNHDELEHKDFPDQHPISSITDLEETLTNMEKLIEESAVIEKTIDTNSLHLEYSKEDKSLTGNVKILNSDDNAIVEKTTGLFVDKYLDIETQDTSDVHLTVEGKGETLETMYNSGHKFSHDGSWNNIANTSEANAWYYDSTLQSFVQPQNTSSYTGFVSTVQYRTYTHRATLKSTDGDNDGIGVIIGYAIDENNRPHTLSFIVNKGGESHVGNYYYALVYDKSLPDEQVLFTRGNKTNGTIPGNHSTSGWYSSTITVEVVKAGALVTCAASNYNSTEINSNTLIEIDLDNYVWGKYFKGKVQYGYSAQSQAHSFFQNIYFEGKGPLKAELILSPEEDNLLLKKDNGIYLSSNTILSDDNRNLLKPLDGKLFLSNQLLKDASSGNPVFYTERFDKEEIQIDDLVCYNPTTNLFEKAICTSLNYKGNLLGIVKSISDERYLYIQVAGVYYTEYFNDNNIPLLTKIYLSSEEESKFTTTETKTYIGYVIDGGIYIDIKHEQKYEDLTPFEIQSIMDKCFFKEVTDNG